MAGRPPTLLVALGGNALIRKGQQGTIQEQFKNLRVPIRQIAELSRTRNIIITHGNGPQVGNLLLQQESNREVPELPLEILVAMTQGQIGYMIESTLDTLLMELKVTPQKRLISLISYVVVDPKDPAFERPSKPIGPIYTAAQAARLLHPTVETAKGFRRVVVSPRPVSIVEKEEIRVLIQQGFIVICCGGGGIPVIRRGRAFDGVDAVIDKDLASARLAREVGVDLFIIATDVKGVFLDYGGPGERFLDKLTPAQARAHLAAGHFPSGSMGPKVEAALDFLEGGGERAVITSIQAITRGLEGRAGTQLVAG